MTNVVVSHGVAQHALFVFGSGGVQPGGFTLALFTAIQKADPMNRIKLAQGFPEHVEAYRLAAEEFDGIETLRKIANP